jgi:hypothetical protein
MSYLGYLCLFAHSGFQLFALFFFECPMYQIDTNNSFSRSDHLCSRVYEMISKLHNQLSIVLLHLLV